MIHADDVLFTIKEISSSRTSLKLLQATAGNHNSASSARGSSGAKELAGFIGVKKMRSIALLGNFMPHETWSRMCSVRLRCWKAVLLCAKFAVQMGTGA